MLPSSYATPAAIVFVLGGALACFAGYRLFRVVLAVYGFILGALVATAAMGTSSTLVLVVAAIIGGLAGAAVALFAYYIGVAAVGAALAALLVSAIWQHLGGEPAWYVVLIAAIAGAIVAIWFTRYVIVFATAFGGAWTMIVGGLALAGNPAAAEAAANGRFWIVYPLGASAGRWWLPALWIALSLAGVLAQLSMGGGGARRARARA